MKNTKLFLLTPLFLLFTGCANLMLDKTDKNLVFNESITDSKLLELEKGQVRKVVKMLKPQMTPRDAIVYHTTVATKFGGLQTILKEELCIDTIVEFARDSNNEIIFLQTKDLDDCSIRLNKKKLLEQIDKNETEIVKKK